MNISIGENIKKLRMERGVTQEKLAAHLGVSTWAVSKWECGKAYPDITLLPGLSGYFGVSIDELMQTSAIRSKQRADELKMSILNNQSQGKLEENMALLRDIIKEYPGDYWFQVVLANHLLMFQSFLRGLPEEPEFLKTNYREAAEIYEHVLNHCADDQLRLTSRLQTFYAYQFIGNNEKAKEMYEKLPLFEQSSILVVPDYLKADERTVALQRAVKKLVAGFRKATLMLTDVGNVSYGTTYTVAERIAIIEKIDKIYELIYEDGDYGYAAGSLHANYAAMAWLAAYEDDQSLVLDCVEKAADFAVIFDTRTETEDEASLTVCRHSSLLLNKSPDYKLENPNLTEQNACWSFLHVTLVNDMYTRLVNLVGSTERYKAIIAKLTQYENAVPVHISRLEELKEKAENGDVGAMVSLGLAYDSGYYGAAVDLAESSRWYLLAAEKNDTLACNNLGAAYLQGRGVPQNYTEALRWFHKSDDAPNLYGKGNPWARENIGTMYKEGLGVEQNYTEALRWYELSAELNFPLAHYRLGELYENGWGVPRDYIKARAYYEKAANPDPTFDGFVYDLPPGAVKKAMERVRGYS